MTTAFVLSGGEATNEFLAGRGADVVPLHAATA
jgi:hypothetical protein